MVKRSAAIKGIKRLNQIGFILARYGLGELLEWTRIRKSKKLDEFTVAQRFRRLLEDLGPTFIKFGQLLSTQEGILPLSFIEELKKLQDDVEPFGFKDVKRIIEKELGKRLEEIFDEFEEKPEASASLGQVHKAKLKNGNYVAIKIQRPGIEEIISSDMFLLRQLGALISKRIRQLFHFDIMPLINEFDKTIHREMDYEVEAHYIEVFKKNLSKFDYVYVPDVYWEFTTQKIITMEYIFGYKATNKQLLIDKGFDLSKMATKGAKVFWYQIFDVGLFHADPHPGNIIIMEDGRICYIDYGMVGKINDDDKMALIEMISGFIEKDVDRIIYSIDNFTSTKEAINEQELKNDIDELIEMYHSLPLKRMNLSRMLREIFSILRKHGILIKRSSSRLLRAIIIADGVGRDFNPDFNFVEIAAPYFKRFAKKFYSPLNIIKVLLRPNPDYIMAAKKLPSTAKHLMDSLQKGSIKVEVEVEEFPRLIDTFRHVARQIGISLIISSIVIGMSILLSYKIGPNFHSIPVVLIISIVIIIVLALGIIDAEKKL
ncbi:ABC1 kinase family protein [Hippea maritima]|uniref:ABC-1 domain-containing protein n=1 Tax=Hippea maritima (strain ATCC 700847 / DSM 10411 / MH2) TaxID=760142 RepID=F2LVB1_HIPMA|nr:AarF/ABC1/UbiB kinase family protein [Hippea maritima]AEA33695.1 ABC-1 domain-containing protein [Hippea maritima DSM 10411]